MQPHSQPPPGQATTTALKIRAADIARVHTVLALAAFLSALVIGSALHFKKIVKNGVAGYPQEWFPSVSATIGDWYPERNVFQILIAINSGPRFALVLLQYHLRRQLPSVVPAIMCITGVVRTLSCGGWVYITSSDDHDAHDVLMILYIVCNIPWMVGNILYTPKEQSRLRLRRTIFALAFFGSLAPMIYFFIEHKVHRVPGAYTHYAFFEWALIFLDVMFDSVTEQEFAEASLELSVACTRLPNDKLKVARSGGDHSGSESESSASREAKPQPKIREGVNAGPGTLETSLSFFMWLAQNRDRVSFLADIFLAYIFWSLYTALIPMLFYFSVWQLGIAGAELALLAFLSPAVLGFDVVRGWVSTKAGRLTCHVLSLPGLLAFVLRKPDHRLILVTFANVFSCIGAASDWSSCSDASVAIQYGIGLLLSSLSKFANHGNNPVWPLVDSRTGGYNWLGLLLTLLALLDFSTRPTTSHSKTSDVKEVSLTECIHKALPFGSLIFSLHCFMTDPSTIISWTWTGYPVSGPIPHIHGTLTLIAQATGILISVSSMRSFVASPAWFVLGSTSAYVLYAFNDWIGYCGGLGLAVFLMSIMPHVMKAPTTTGSMGIFYLMSFSVAIILYLANVWTVAYAFVPAGFLLRERSDIVLFAQMACLLPAFIPRGTGKVESSATEDNSKVRPMVINTLSVIVILSSIVSAYRNPISAIQPHRPGPRMIRAGIWTVHFGMDNEGRDSQRAMRDLVQDMELDIVGLLETDLHRPVYGNRDLTRVMVEDIGYYVDIGPGPNHHTWGAVLLSKFPIINSTHHLLPSPHGELAPAISAYLDCFGTEVLVVVAHNGQEEDPLDRELQSKELARLMREAYPTPTIFLGYVVTKPHAKRPSPYQILIEDGRMYDIDQDDSDRWCEYILYRGLYRTSYLRMSRGKVTDTELQAGQFVVPRHGTIVTDQPESSRYLNNFKESMDGVHWFPMAYYGNPRTGGKNGHYYHVFNTPLYYNLPPDALL